MSIPFAKRTSHQRVLSEASHRAFSGTLREPREVSPKGEVGKPKVSALVTPSGEFEELGDSLVRLINDKRAKLNAYRIKKLKEENNKLKNIFQERVPQCSMCNNYIEDEESMFLSDCDCYIAICNRCKDYDNGVMDTCAGCSAYLCVNRCSIKCDGCNKSFCEGECVKFCWLRKYGIYEDKCCQCPYPLPHSNISDEMINKYHGTHKSFCKSCFQLKTKN